MSQKEARLPSLKYGKGGGLDLIGVHRVGPETCLLRDVDLVTRVDRSGLRLNEKVRDLS